MQRNSCKKRSTGTGVEQQETESDIGPRQQPETEGRKASKKQQETEGGKGLGQQKVVRENGEGERKKNHIGRKNNDKSSTKN